MEASDLLAPVRCGADDSVAVAERWLAALGRALAVGDATSLAGLFAADGYWRDLVGLGPDIRTVMGAGAIAGELAASAAAASVRRLDPAPDILPPGPGELAGRRTIDAWFRFETATRTGIGQVRLDPGAGGDEPRAWTLMTAIDALKGHDLETERRRRDGTIAFERDWTGPNWADRRAATTAFGDRDPEVLIVGAGHGGLTAAAWLNALNVDNLVVDLHPRVGDNWRERYKSLKLHSPIASIDFPFLKYPQTWPKYIPKDKIANWMEFYADAMEINAWTSTEFLGAGRAAGDARWTARLKRADGTERMMRPAHIVLATSQVGVPNIPHIPGLDAFGGTVIHSSGFAGGAAWAGRRALVIGTGTSAHDIAQELHAFGAEATMVQRGVTEVFQIEPSAHLYLDALYEQPGPDLEVKDLIACSVPMDVGTAQQRLVTPVVRRHDKDLLDRLERAGFRVERDPNGAGWPTKYLLRGGGYYFNVGCSDLIADGAIGIVQYDDIERWEADGPVLRDGRRVPVDLVVLATGFKGFEEALPRWFGAETAARIGKVWGLDPVTREVSNMWTRTAEPGLWFTGGSFVHSRIYSKYLALQIKQDLTNARS